MSGAAALATESIGTTAAIAGISAVNYKGLKIAIVDSEKAHFATQSAFGGKAGAAVARIDKDILSDKVQELSLMPEGLLQSSTAQEAADLLAYIGQLK